MKRLLRATGIPVAERTGLSERTRQRHIPAWHGAVGRARAAASGAMSAIWGMVIVEATWPILSLIAMNCRSAVANVLAARARELAIPAPHQLRWSVQMIKLDCRSNRVDC